LPIQLNGCGTRLPSERQTVRVKISADGETWTRIDCHDGKPTFGGFISADCALPLVVNLKARQARFVRIECAGRNCLRLDEVEIFGRAVDGGDPREIRSVRKKLEKAK
jgi:hypothetical protein